MQFDPKEYKVVAVRDANRVTETADGPKAAVAYWQKNIAIDPAFKPEQEQFYVLMLNAREQIIGHVLVGLGSIHSVMAEPREIFRPAIIAGAVSVVLMHNHPSGETSPSENDMKQFMHIFAAGDLLGIKVLDSLVIGKDGAFESTARALETSSILDGLMSTLEKKARQKKEQKELEPTH